jgi:hypothetical protein
MMIAEALRQITPVLGIFYITIGGTLVLSAAIVKLSTFLNPPGVDR